MKLDQELDDDDRHESDDHQLMLSDFEKSLKLIEECFSLHNTTIPR